MIKPGLSDRLPKSCGVVKEAIKDAKTEVLKNEERLRKSFSPIAKCGLI